MAEAITNPLAFVTTGARVLDSGRFAALDTLLEPGLTKFVHQDSTLMRMSGNSSYVYNDWMNQGSFSASGGYGADGIAKFSCALSGYVGRTQSTKEKTLSITLNCTKTVGIEHIDFSRLSMAQFIAGLTEPVRRDVQAVLAKYVEVVNAQNDEKVNNEEKAEKLAQWVKSVENFFKANGSGIVVGTLWGGWGAVTLTFKSTSNADYMVYGGSTEFRYTGLDYSGSISATYGGSKQSLGENVTVDVTSSYNGACMREVTEKWNEGMNAVALGGLDAVGKTAVSEPKFNTDFPKAKPPEFRQPKADKSVVDRLGPIKDTKGLELFAEASAYDKYTKTFKPTENEPKHKELKEWLAERDKPVPVEELKGALDPNEKDPRDGRDDLLLQSEISVVDRWVPDDRALEVVAEEEVASSSAAGADKDPGPGDFSSFSPMGVWVANWSQLFPWLVSGHSNYVPASSPPIAMYHLRVLLQDFLTLAKNYELFAQNKRLTVPLASGITFTGIANDFRQASFRITEFIAKPVDDNGVPRDPDVELKKRLTEGLSEDSRIILNTWRSHGFLRRAGLGLGITLHAPRIADPIVRWQPRTIVSFRNSGDERNKRQPNLATCAFGPNNRDYALFADCIKGWPLIYPKGAGASILCYVEGPDRDNCGILACDRPNANGNLNFYVWPKIPDGGEWLAFDQHAVHFTLPPEDKMAPPPKDVLARQPHLYGTFGNGVDDASLFECSVRLWPIPYEAAKGIEWHGQSMAAGDGGLQERVLSAVDGIGRMQSWSLDSDHWKDLDLDSGFSWTKIKPSYFGLIAEPSNV